MEATDLGVPAGVGVPFRETGIEEEDQTVSGHKEALALCSVFSVKRAF